MFPALSTWSEEVRHLKETAVAGDHWGGDMPPIVRAYRADGTRIGEVVSPTVNRDDGLVAAMMMANVFIAEVIWMAVDARVTSEVNNPVTGKPWKIGEMQDLAKVGLDVSGLLQETIVLMSFQRDGTVDGLQLPYRVEGKTVRWEEPFTPDQTIGMLVDAVIDKAFKGPSMVDAAIRDGLMTEDEREEMEPRIIATVLDQFLQRGYIVLLDGPTASMN